MTNLEPLLNHFDAVVAALRQRHFDPEMIDDLKAVHKTFTRTGEELKEALDYQHQMENLLRIYKKADKDIETLSAKMATNRTRISRLEEKRSQAADALRALARRLPDNLLKENRA